MLRQDGWLESNGRRGVCVSSITLKNVKDLFQLRYEVEPVILKIAFKHFDHRVLTGLNRDIEAASQAGNLAELARLDDALHDEILNSSRNDLAVGVVGKIMEQTKRFRYLSYVDEGQTLKGARDHQALIDAILADDLERAQSVLREHIDGNQLYFVRNVDLNAFE